jgi:hypothetical protein
MPELAFLLRHRAVGHDERHPPGRSRLAQCCRYRGVRHDVADQPGPQFGEKPAVAAAVQAEPLADQRS